MAISLSVFLVSCVPSIEPPQPSGKSMFVAVELENGNYWVYSSEVNGDEVDFPTIVVDGERRVDVYFFGCSLDEFSTAGGTPSAGFLGDDFVPAARAGPSFSRHPKALKGYTTRVSGGRLEDWSVTDELAVDLMLQYRCPQYSVPRTVELPGVSPETAWVVGGATQIWVGSAHGELYSINEDGSAELKRTDVFVVDMTEFDGRYYAVIRSAVRLTVLAGGSPDAVDEQIGEEVADANHRRLRVGKPDDMLRFALADRENHFRFGTEDGWSDRQPICASSLCAPSPAKDVFLTHTTEFGFVGGTTNHGCVGSEGQDEFDLPEQPRSPDEPCLTLGGMDYHPNWGLLVSTGTELWSRGPQDWEPETGSSRGLDSIGGHGRVVPSADAAMVVNSDQIAMLFKDGPLCRYPDPVQQAVVIGAAKTENGIFVVSHDERAVYASLLREERPLNTCSD